MPVDSYTRYLLFGNRRVAGWLTPTGRGLVDRVLRAQRQLDVRGDVAEIGVHHGRFFILLALSCQASERAYAADLFEQQALNVDRSGKGDLQAFQSNLTAHAVTAPVETIAGDSLELSPERFGGPDGPRVRMFSVDGGHTARHAFNDLSLAASCITDGGIVVLDDCFNQMWPGVSDGVHQFFAQMPLDAIATVAPFLIGGNKVFLTTDGWQQMYTASLLPDLRGRGYFVKSGEMLGSEVLIARRTTRDGVLRRVANSLPPSVSSRLLTSRFGRLRRAAEWSTATRHAIETFERTRPIRQTATTT